MVQPNGLVRQIVLHILGDRVCDAAVAIWKMAKAAAVGPVGVGVILAWLRARENMPPSEIALWGLLGTVATLAGVLLIIGMAGRLRGGRPTTKSSVASVIHSAKYGAANKWREVSHVLRERNINGAVSLLIDNHTMGGDPISGKVKRLEMEYSVDGLRLLKRVPEGGTLTLPEFPATGDELAVRWLERHYMRALVEVQDARRSKKFQDAGGSGDVAMWLAIEGRLNAIRGDLINAAPTIFSVATALEFQKPAPQSTDIGTRVIDGGEQLLNAIQTKWTAYGGLNAPLPSVLHTGAASQIQGA